MFIDNILPTSFDPNAQWFKDAHPSNLYHTFEHSLSVAEVAYRFAKAREVSEKSAVFLAKVALLHDFDPHRKADTPARVPVTLSLLSKDFWRVKSLKVEEYCSVLGEEFKWGKRELLMAKAIIQRTEFPFSRKHLDAAYRDTSPYDQYDQILRQLSVIDYLDVLFVLQEAPLFAEYADKSNTFLTKGYADAVQAVERLYEEQNNHAAMGLSKGDFVTGNYEMFIKKLGASYVFNTDRRIAKDFGFIDIQYPNIKVALELMPAEWVENFTTNCEKFKELCLTEKSGSDY